MSGGYLFNGVWMPSLYSRYAEEYDNVILAPGDELVGSYYCFAFSKSPFTTYEENGSIVIRRVGDQPLAYVNHAGDTNWTTGNPTNMSFRIQADKVVWTNHNIYNEDGSLYLAASDPVPVSQLNHAAMLMGYFLGQTIRQMKSGWFDPAKMDPGLYKTGTTNLIYSWDQLLGDDILDGGVLSVVDGELTGNHIYPDIHLNCPIRDILVGDLILPRDGSITSIAYAAFETCWYMTGISIPSSVVCFGEHSFLNCELTSVYIDDLEVWLRYDFSQVNGRPYCQVLYINGKPLTELVVPRTITEIGAYAFEFYGGLKSVIIPNWVISIGNSAFNGCNNLTSVILSDAITVIPDAAFSGCGFTEIVLPKSLVSIGAGAFSGCKSLQSVDIPGTVTEIATTAFSLCKNISRATFGGTVAQWNQIDNTDTPIFRAAVNANNLQEIVCADGTVLL